MSDIIPLITILLIWIVALCAHEYSHARVAFAGGDHTVEEKGYLSFNPFRYMDPMNSIVWPVIILLIGGVPLPGGAVWIETHRIRSKGWLSAMSLAGPAANVLMAILLGLPFRLGIVPVDSTVGPILALSCFFQIYAAFLNLLPVPGLDGFGALLPWLPESMQDFTRRAGRVMPFVILIIAMNTPQFGAAFISVMRPILSALHVPFSAIRDGFQLLPGQ